MLFLALAAAVGAPQPGPLKTFTDWTVGCDNGRACRAVALLSDSLEGASLVLDRGPEPNAPVAARFTARDEGAVSADLGDRTLRLRDGKVAAADWPALLAALRTAPSIAVKLRDGSASAVSLKGASAALLYMDEQQRRGGTATALVRPGGRSARAVPPPPALPVIVRPAASARPVPRLDRAALLKAHADLGCDLAAKPDAVDAERLDAAHTLVLIPDRCGSGAYNYFSAVLVADNAGRVRPAAFDSDPGMGEAAGSTAVNAGWDPATRLFDTYAKGRGIGDCGVRQTFAWDGRRFRLVRREEMGECRGSIDYVTTWRAEVR